MKLLFIGLLLWNIGYAQTTDSIDNNTTIDTNNITFHRLIHFGEYDWAIYVTPEFTLSRGVQPGIHLGFGSFDAYPYGFSGLGVSGGIAYNFHRDDLVIGGNIFGAAIIVYGGPNARLGVNYHMNSGKPFVGIKAELGLAIAVLFFNYSYERNISERDLPRHIHSFTLTTYLPAIRWGRKNKNDLTPIPYWSD